nr:MAG TPA: winged helix-turn-helix domain protein [Caudoviricetes sp.]
MIKIGVPYNMDMLAYIKKYGPVDFNELCTKFGNGYR